MADRRGSLWTYRAVFAAVAALIAFVQLLPLDMRAQQVPGPDVLTLLAFSWVVMRPDFVPVALLAIVFFLGDILFMRPLGLWTALVILGAEFLRSRSVALRETSFLSEWTLVAGVYAAILTANTMILALFAVDQAGLGLTMIRLIATILVYPLVVILGGRAVGLKKIVPGEVDRLGHRQ